MIRSVGYALHWGLGGAVRGLGLGLGLGLELELGVCDWGDARRPFVRTWFSFCLFALNLVTFLTGS